MRIRLTPRMQSMAVAIVCGLLSGSCRFIALSASFDPNAAQYVLDTGANAISGRAWLIVPPFGHTRSCQSNGVQLIPVTAYATERMARTFGEKSFVRRGALEMLPEDKAFERYTRHADCDERGSFRFEHVADGKYWLLAKVYWQMRFARGGYGLLREIVVRNCESKVVEMKQDLMDP